MRECLDSICNLKTIPLFIISRDNSVNRTELDAPGNDCCAIQMGPQPISLIVCTMPLTVDGVETTPILDASSGMLVFAMCSSASESRFAQDRQIGRLLHRQHTEASEPLAVLTMDFEPQARHLSMQHHCGLCSFTGIFGTWSGDRAASCAYARLDLSSREALHIGPLVLGAGHLQIRI